MVRPRCCFGLTDIKWPEQEASLDGLQIWPFLALFSDLVAFVAAGLKGCTANSGRCYLSSLRSFFAVTNIYFLGKASVIFVLQNIILKVKQAKLL